MLASIKIPNSVTEIGEGAFGRCGGLTSVYSYLQNVTSSVSPYDLFDTHTYNQATLYVPKGYINNYKKANSWENFKNIKEFDVSGINDIKVDDLDEGLWYDLNGHIYDQKPTEAGIYIHNHSKVIVK